MAQELKDYDIMDIEAMDDERLEKSSSGKIFVTRVYIKDEVDAVLAEKDKKIDLYKRGFEEIDKINAYLFAEARHHKYKRCLAMARWCERKRIDAADYRIPREKWEFYDKWHKHWLELAEKFKEA